MGKTPERVLAANRRRRNFLRARGLCVACGRPAGLKVHCVICRQRFRKVANAKYRDAHPNARPRPHNTTLRDQQDLEQIASGITGGITAQPPDETTWVANTLPENARVLFHFTCPLFPEPFGCKFLDVELPDHLKRPPKPQRLEPLGVNLHGDELERYLRFRSLRESGDPIDAFPLGSNGHQRYSDTFAGQEAAQAQKRREEFPAISHNART